MIQLTAVRNFNVVITQVQTVQIWKIDVWHVHQVALCKIQVNQHCVVCQVVCAEFASSCGKVPDLRIITGKKEVVTAKSQSVTFAHIWTGKITKQFVVKQRAVMHAITHVVRMNTHLRSSAAVESWACVGVTCHFVLVVRAVKHAVTPHVDR